MNKLLWLIAAALAVIVVTGCIHNVFEGTERVRNNSGSVPVGGIAERIPLHEMPAAEIAAEFVRHTANLTGYSATVHTTGDTEYEDDEYRFFAQRPDKFRAEYIRSEIHGNGTIVVANGTFVWQYHPDTKNARPALIEDPSNTFFAWKDYPAIAARILEKSPAVLNRTETKAGSTSVILEATIDDIPTQYYPTIFSRIRVWIDENSLMMTRMEMIGEYNETVLTVDLRNISVNPLLPDEMFDFAPPLGTEISPTIAELLAPLNQSSMYQAKVRFGQALRENEVSFGPYAEQEMTIPIGNRTGTFWSASGRNHIRWNCGNGTYELAGPPTKDELVRIAQSLTRPDLLNFAPGEIQNPETIAEIALRDPSARRMVDSGGEILGVGMSVKRSTKNIQGGVFPALSIRYNRILVDFMVDPVLQRSVGRTIQVPNGAMINHQENQTIVEYNGEILFTFDPIEEEP